MIYSTNCKYNSNIYIYISVIYHTSCKHYDYQDLYRGTEISCRLFRYAPGIYLVAARGSLFFFLMDKIMFNNDLFGLTHEKKTHNILILFKPWNKYEHYDNVES